MVVTIRGRVFGEGDVVAYREVDQIYEIALRHADTSAGPGAANGMKAYVTGDCITLKEAYESRSWYTTVTSIFG